MDGVQKEKLHDALLEAFDPADLARMLRFRLNRKLALYVGSDDDFRHQVFRLLEAAEREGWLLQLVVQASQYRPYNAALLKTLQEYDLAPVPRHEINENYAPFERIIAQTDPFIDPLEWFAQAGRAMRCVCFVTISHSNGQTTTGTGFLVGPDTILTNYHVVKPVIQKTTSATGVRVRFDYCVAPNGYAVFAGVEYALLSGDDWLIDYSPYDTADQYDAPQANPDPENLDYALLRLAKPAGNIPAGRLDAGNRDEDAPPRGWIVLPESTFDWTGNRAMPLFILQHPRSGPLKLAYRSDAQIIVNGNGTRVRYSVNTEPGASGSPCFTNKWQPVALHHAGDPDYTQMARYNQGIPLATIATRIKRNEDGKNAISQIPPTLSTL